MQAKANTVKQAKAQESMQASMMAKMQAKMQAKSGSIKLIFGLAIVLLLVLGCTDQTLQQANSGAGVKTYTTQEVSLHNSISDCWVILDKNVYNVTPLISTDSIVMFANFCGGELVNNPAGQAPQDYNLGMPRPTMNQPDENRDLNSRPITSQNDFNNPAPGESIPQDGEKPNQRIGEQGRNGFNLNQYLIGIVE